MSNDMRDSLRANWGFAANMLHLHIPAKLFMNHHDFHHVPPFFNGKHLTFAVILPHCWLINAARKAQVNRPWFLAISATLMTVAFLSLHLGKASGCRHKNFRARVVVLQAFASQLQEFLQELNVAIATMAPATVALFPTCRNLQKLSHGSLSSKCWKKHIFHPQSIFFVAAVSLSSPSLPVWWVSAWAAASRCKQPLGLEWLELLETHGDFWSDRGIPKSPWVSIPWLRKTSNDLMEVKMEIVLSGENRHLQWGFESFKWC